MNELKGYDNWKLSHAEETECILQPCIVCSADAETPSAWLCFDCDMDFKAYDQMQVYGNQHGNSGVTGYFVDDSQNHLYVEFNDKVIYRYDQSQIGNQLYQNMIKHAEDGNGLSRLIFRMQPKYHHKTLHTELQDMAKDREVITIAEYAEDMKAEMQINAGR